MYISRIALRPERFRVRDIASLAESNEYARHRTIWKFFSYGQKRTRDFIYRSDIERGRPIFYTVSSRPPVDESALWEIRTKVYTPKISVGQRLAFKLRANPVHTKRDDDGRQHRHDVVMEAKTILREKGERRSAVEVMQEAGYEWLNSRAEKNGFFVQKGSVRVDGYRVERFVKGRQRMRVSLGILDFSGILTVTDTDALLDALYGGIGPAKGFGCGMLMVRRC